jgi:RNA polymerase sigma factor (sigma-70 family)
MLPTENATWALLRDLLAERYDEFRTRLSRWLGSDELARESLNETWLRLHREDNLGPVQNPASYVLRTAANIATDWRRGDQRRAKRSEVREVIELASSAPDAERELGARQELAMLQRAVRELPERTRKILIAARVHGREQREIAAEFGISTRMVRLELRRALDFCEAQMQKSPDDHFLSEPPQSSWQKK